MKTVPSDPKALCLKLLKRSNCSVQVSAVLTTKGIVTAVGWNHSGPSGFGEHAEQHCFKRSNFKSIPKSVLYVAARRKKSKNPVIAKPCALCWSFCRNCSYIVYRDKTGNWVTLRGDL